MKSAKRLLLVRHAKSDWNHPNLSDHDRPLNERGKKDVVRIAKYLADKSEKPAVIYASTANRATETARSIAEILNYDLTEIRREQILYNSSCEDYLDLIAEIDDQFESAMIVGHNPIMEELVSLLTSGNYYNDEVYMSTCAVASLGLTRSQWAHSKPGLWELEWFISPKLLKK